MGFNIVEKGHRFGLDLVMLWSWFGFDLESTWSWFGSELGHNLPAQHVSPVLVRGPSKSAGVLKWFHICFSKFGPCPRDD